MHPIPVCYLFHGSYRTCLVYELRESYEDFALAIGICLTHYTFLLLCGEHAITSGHLARAFILNENFFSLLVDECFFFEVSRILQREVVFDALRGRWYHPIQLEDLHF